MKDIRKYREDKERGYKEKIRKHRQSKLRFFCIVAGTIAFVVLAFFLYHTLRVYSGYTIKNVLERTESSSSVTVQIGENLVSYSKDGASCVDIEGNKVWNQTYEMQKPIVGITEKSIAISDYNGRNIYVMNSENILGTISTNMPIKDVAVSESGIVASVQEDGNTTWIYVYDTKGNVLVFFKTKMSNSGYPVTVALSPDAMLMAVSYLYVDSGIMRSSVGFYNFGEVGQNELHNYVGGFNYTDSLIPYVKFLNSEIVVAVADDRIMFYKGHQKPVVLRETLINQEILGIYSSTEHIGMVFENDQGASKYRMDLYNLEGEQEDSLEFECEYEDIVITEKAILIYNKNEWNVYTIGGRKKFSGVYEENIQKIITTDSIEDYLIVTGESLEKVVLK